MSDLVEESGPALKAGSRNQIVQFLLASPRPLRIDAAGSACALLAPHREGAMDEAAEKAVQRAIATMRDNLGEQVTVEDMARAAMFSKFHFTRVFRRVTGVSPARFLAALRLEQAKRLLVSTSLRVADISVRVGYSSVGTFSSRFSKSVGLSPAEYRRLGGYIPQITVDQGRRMAGRATAVIQGEVWPHRGERQALVFVGLFPERIPEGRPARCTILTGPGPYRLEEVPPGTWYLMAYSLTAERTESGRLPIADETPWVGIHGPLTIGSDTTTRVIDVRLRPMRALDPPVLLALLDVRAQRELGAPAPAGCN
jgi:AraC-like DNA-binding protein